jgi:hypothetical protein
MIDSTLTLSADGPELDHGVSALPCWVNPSTRALPTHTNKHHRPHHTLNYVCATCRPRCCISRRASGALLVRCAAARTHTHMCVRCTALSSTTMMTRLCWKLLTGCWITLESCDMRGSAYSQCSSTAACCGTHDVSFQLSAVLLADWLLDNLGELRHARQRLLLPTNAATHCSVLWQVRRQLCAPTPSSVTIAGEL